MSTKIEVFEELFKEAGLNNEFNEVFSIFKNVLTSLTNKEQSKILDLSLNLKESFSIVKKFTKIFSNELLNYSKYTKNLISMKFPKYDELRYLLLDIEEIQASKEINELIIEEIDEDIFQNLINKIHWKGENQTKITKEIPSFQINTTRKYVEIKKESNFDCCPTCGNSRLVNNQYGSICLSCYTKFKSIKNGTQTYLIKVIA